MRSLTVGSDLCIFVFGTTIATDSTIIYYYRSPGHHMQLRRARLSAKYQFGEVFLRMCKFCLPLDRLIWLQCS
jgi:hypothetical protein